MLFVKREKTEELGLHEMSEHELQEFNGGGFVAAVYALGFVMGMSPLGALIVCTTVIAGGITAGVLVNKSQK